METFEQWWKRVGTKIDSESEKAFAEEAWNAAVAQSRNYVADEYALVWPAVLLVASWALRATHD